MSEKKSCVDCLHCKVSAKSKENDRWCFCAVSKNALRYKEIYWQIKRKVCKKFEDMTEKPITLVIVQAATANKRMPLLKKQHPCCFFRSEFAPQTPTKAFETTASRGEPSPLRGSVEYTMPPKARKRYE